LVRREKPILLRASLAGAIVGPPQQIADLIDDWFTD
jgi:hypothetical protein